MKYKNMSFKEKITFTISKKVQLSTSKFVERPCFQQSFLHLKRDCLGFNSYCIL
jgi:hypothetical protein